MILRRFSRSRFPGAAARLVIILAVGGGPLSIAIGGVAQGATPTATRAHSAPTLSELQSRANKLAARAGRARKAADAAATAAANAEANLRLAENSLASTARTSGTHQTQLQLPTAQQNFAVTQAQAQLQQAQQRAQAAQMQANMPSFSPPSQGVKGIAPLLGSVNQGALQSAQAGVIAAQQRLTAAQQSAAMNAQAADFANNFDSTGVASAQQSVTTARQLAAAAKRAAQAAELNAETLAEDADRARAAVAAAQSAH